MHGSGNVRLPTFGHVRAELPAKDGCFKMIPYPAGTCRGGKYVTTEDEISKEKLILKRALEVGIRFGLLLLLVVWSFEIVIVLA